MTSKILFLAIFFSFYFGAVAQNTLKSVTQIEFSDSVNLWKHYDNLRKDKIVSKPNLLKGFAIQLLRNTTIGPIH